MAFGILIAAALGSSAPVAGTIEKGGLQFIGEPTCPTAPQLMEQLSALHPSLGAERFSAEVSSADPGASPPNLRLFDSSGALVAERRFAGLSDCSQRARAMAATIAVWLGDLSAQVPLLLDSPPLAATGRGPALEGRPQEFNPPSSISAVSSSGHTWRLEIGAGALGSIDNLGDGVGWAEVRVSTRPRTWRLGLQAELSWEGARALALGAGFAEWQRVALGGGIHYPLGRPGLGIELEADALLGVAVTQGRVLGGSWFK